MEKQNFIEPGVFLAYVLSLSDYGDSEEFKNLPEAKEDADKY